MWKDLSRCLLFSCQFDPFRIGDTQQGRTCFYSRIDLFTMAAGFLFQEALQCADMLFQGCTGRSQFQHTLQSGHFIQQQSILIEVCFLVGLHQLIGSGLSQHSQIFSRFEGHPFGGSGRDLTGNRQSHLVVS